MDEIPPSSPDSELHARDKRTLRDAVDGSPSRPDAKVGRGNIDVDDPSAKTFPTEEPSTAAINARCASNGSIFVRECTLHNVV